MAEGRDWDKEIYYKWTCLSESGQNANLPTQKMFLKLKSPIMILQAMLIIDGLFIFADRNQP